MAVLLAAALFYSGMKDYVKVGKTDIAVVELYGDYPAVNLAKQIWENYQSSDEITDFWLEKGVDGFRLDAAKEYETGSINSNIEILSWFNNMVKEKKSDAYIVTEVWSDLETYAQYYQL